MAFFDRFKYFFNPQVDRLRNLIVSENLQVYAQAKDDKRALKNLERQYSFQASQMLTRLAKLGYSKPEIDKILEIAPTVDVIRQIIEYTAKAKTIGLKYFTPKYVIKALEKGWDVATLFEIAEKFEHHNLEEEPDFANFEKLFTYPNFNKEHVKDLVNILIQFKYHEIKITQEQIIRYFNISRPESEDLKNFYLGVLISREKKLDLKVGDFIKGILDKRMPRALASTYAKIKENALAISKERYMTMGVDQSVIDRIVNFMILAKKHGLIIDFDDILKQYSAGNNVFDVLRILIKLHESGFTQVDFAYLTKLATFKVDLSKVLSAFNYAKANLDLDDFMKSIDRVLPIRKTDDEEALFDLVNFAKAIHIGTTVFGIDKDTILNDYISGIDVWKIIDLMKYAKDMGVEVNYIVAKILYLKGELSDVIYKTLNPFEITTDYIHVTTKDNIEIKTRLIILVTYNLANYFKGTDEEYLIRLIRAVFIDEIQRHYDHDEIIQNIEKISRSILQRLLPPEEGGAKEDNLSKFIAVSKFKPIKIIIPQIEFVKDTFKEIDKIKHQYHTEKEMMDLELQRLRAEIKIKEAWAKSPDLRFLILKDEEDDNAYSHRGYHSEQDNE